MFAVGVFGRSATAFLFRDELIRVRNTQNNVEPLSGDVTDLRVGEVVRDRHTTQITVSEHTVPLGLFGFVVVFPVGGQQTGVLERVSADDSVTNEVSLTRDFNAVETPVDVEGLTHFGFQVEAESFAFTVQSNHVESFVVRAVTHLLKQRSALLAGVICKVAATEEFPIHTRRAGGQTNGNRSVREITHRLNWKGGTFGWRSSGVIAVPWRLGVETEVG